MQGNAASRKESVERFKRIKAMSELIVAFRPHQPFMDTLSSYDAMNKARVDILNAMKAARSTQREVIRAKFRDRNHTSIHMATTEILGRGRRRAPRVLLYLGKEIGGIRSARPGGYTTYQLKLGHMWHYKVYKTLYVEPWKQEYGDWFILSAERMRVNAKGIHLFECQIFDKQKGEQRTGYIALTRNLKKNAAFLKLTAVGAVNAASNFISETMNDILKGTEDDQNT